MGIDQEPGEHLDNTAWSLAVAGGSPEGDVANAEKYWSGEWKRRQRALAAAVDVRVQLAIRTEQFLLGEADAMRAERIREQLGRFKEVRGELEKLEGPLARAALYEDIARSKPARTKTAAIRIVKAIGQGEATDNQAKHRRPIAARGIEAHERLVAIDAIAAPLKPARDRAVALRCELSALEEELRSLISAPEAEANVDRSAAEPVDADEISRILEWIKDTHLLVLADDQGRVSPRLVMGLSPAEAAILERNWFRSVAFLRKRFEFQELELGRLRSFRRSKSEAFKTLVEEGGRGAAPMAIVTLFRRYEGHPEVQAWPELVARNEVRREAAEETRRAEARHEEERALLGDWLEQVEGHRWAISVGSDHRCSVPRDKIPDRIAVILKDKDHAEFARLRLAEIRQDQTREMDRLVLAIKSLPDVQFDGAVVSARTFSDELRSIFTAYRNSPDVGAALRERVSTLYENPIRLIADVLRRDAILVVSAGRAVTVPTDRLTPDQVRFLAEHVSKKPVQVALKSVAAYQAQCYVDLLKEIEEMGVAPATADGVLDAACVRSDFAPYARLWKKDPNVVAQLHRKVGREREGVETSLLTIDAQGLLLEKSADKWMIDDRLPLIDRLRLESPAHAARVLPRLAAIHERRVKEGERKRVDTLLDRVEQDRHSIQPPPPHWTFDERISASDQTLLARWVDEPAVRARLEAMLAERRRAAAAALAEEEKAKEARNRAAAEAAASAAAVAAKQVEEARERAAAEAATQRAVAEPQPGAAQPSDKPTVVQAQEAPRESRPMELVISEVAQAQSEQPRQSGSAGDGLTGWGAKFDRLIADAGIDLVDMTTASIALVREALAGSRQTIFASKNKSGICLCSDDDHVAETLARADYWLLMALHELALERGGEVALRGHTIHIPFHPGTGGPGRGASR